MESFVLAEHPSEWACLLEVQRLRIIRKQQADDGEQRLLDDVLPLRDPTLLVHGALHSCTGEISTSNGQNRFGVDNEVLGNQSVKLKLERLIRRRSAGAGDGNTEVQIEPGSPGDPPGDRQ